MELKQLRFFVTVAQLENVNRAADKLHVAQSALSRQIQSLEYDLRIQLFERSGKHIKLSAHGAIFLEEAKAILARVDQARDNAKLMASGALNRLRIGFHQVAGRHFVIPEACHAFRQQFPDILLNFKPLTAQEQISALRRNEIDAAICHLTKYSGPRGILPILVDRWVIAFPSDHRLANAKEIYLADLTNESFITINPERAPMHLDDLHGELSRRGFDVQSFQEVHEEAMMVNLISLGMGIGFVMDTGYRPPNVVMRKIADFSLSHELCLMWNPQDENEALDKFIDVMRKFTSVD